MSFSHKDKKKHIWVTNIHNFWHLDLVCILLLEAIISLVGKKILLFVCGVFFFLFFCAFPPRDCSPVLPHPRTHRQNPHNSTSSNTVSWWSGTSRTPFSTDFKEPVPVLSHDSPRIPTALPGPPWGSWRSERALWQKRTPWQTDWWDFWLHDVTFWWPLLNFQS